MKHTKILAYLVLIIFLTFSCDRKEVVTSNEQTPPVVSEIYIGNAKVEGKPFYYPVLIDKNGNLKQNSELSSEERKILRKQRSIYMGAKRKIRKALTLPVSDADQKIREVISSTKNHPLSHMIEQFGSNMMLRKIFNLKEKSYDQESIQRIGFYTDKLIKDRHPDAEVILPALQVLKNSWSKEKIEKSLQISMDAANEYVKKSKRKAKKLGLKSLKSDSETKKIINVENAVSNMRDLKKDLIADGDQIKDR